MNACEAGEYVPQGLKPLCLSGSCGMTEVMPCYKTDSLGMAFGFGILEVERLKRA